MQLVEQVASGIPRMRNEMREVGLPEPVFHTEGFFTITLMRPNTTKVTLKTIEFELLDTQKSIVAMMQRNSKVTVIDMVSQLNLSKKTIIKHINILKKEKIVERKGSNFNGNWYVLHPRGDQEVTKR
ncbi:hypothetical protein FACS1894201_11190 [Bacteroidia bacterium]|nr:hypothetical protein FACS1894201_11190 [Bacteroidia bacterium]